MNRIALIVYHGLILPYAGARILQACASIIDMPLLKELPDNEILVQGLIKSDDVAQGCTHLMDAFSPFGEIVDVSTAPQNRGFGEWRSISDLCPCDVYFADAFLCHFFPLPNRVCEIREIGIGPCSAGGAQNVRDRSGRCGRFSVSTVGRDDRCSLHRSFWLTIIEFG